MSVHPADHPGEHTGAPRRRPGAGIVVLAAIVALAAAGIAVVLLRHGTGRAPSAAGVAADPTRAVFTHPQLVQTYVAAATSDIAAVSSYDYRRLDDALTTGLAVTTGRYRQDYRAALTGQLAADARAHHRVQQFQLQQLGAGTMAGDGSRATVLAFGVQTVTDDSTGRAAPHLIPVVLTATLVRAGGRVLISQLAADRNAGLPPGSAGLAAAAEAARAAVVARVGPVEAVAVQSADGAGASVLIAATRGRRVLRYVVSVARRAGQWVIAGASAVPPY